MGDSAVTLQKTLTSVQASTLDRESTTLTPMRRPLNRADGSLDYTLVSHVP